MNSDTVYVKNQVMSTSSVKELLDYIQQNDDQFNSWQRFIKKQVDIHGRSFEKFGILTGFSKNTIKCWCSGVFPKNRDAFIKLSFGLRMNVEETNKLLVKYGGYSALYAKDIYDAITIYVINRRQNNWNDPAYSYDALDMWFNKYHDIRGAHTIDTNYLRQNRTIGIYNDIISIQNDEAFEKFILDNRAVFLSTYSSLITFIDDFIRIRISEKEDALDESGNRDKLSWHRIINERGVDKALEKSLSELRQKGILPKRKILIAMGINLNMVEPDINKMLSLANMQPLYAKDKAEALLMYVLKNAEKTDSVLKINNAFHISELTTDRSIRNEYKKMIDRYMDEYDDLTDEQIECVAQFIRAQLEGHSVQDFFENLF